MSFSSLKKFSIPSLLRSFIMGVTDVEFVKCSFCLYWDDYTVFLFYSINTVNYIYWFFNIKSILHSLNKPHFVKIHYPFLYVVGLRDIGLYFSFIVMFLSAFSIRILWIECLVPPGFLPGGNFWTVEQRNGIQRHPSNLGEVQSGQGSLNLQGKLLQRKELCKHRVS